MGNSVVFVICFGCLIVDPSVYSELWHPSPANLDGYICSDRAIPAANIDLHFAHCSRNLEKCKICEDMVPKKFAEEHFLSTHAPVSDLIV